VRKIKERRKGRRKQKKGKEKKSVEMRGEK